jgi:hypothetical protein
LTGVVSWKAEGNVKAMTEMVHFHLYLSFVLRVLGKKVKGLKIKVFG